MKGEYAWPIRRTIMTKKLMKPLKNSLDMQRLRLHSSGAMRARLLIQFLSLVIMSKMRGILKSDPKLKHMTVREVVEAMETITVMKLSGRYGHIVSEAGPLQRDIMTAFGVESPT